TPQERKLWYLFLCTHPFHFRRQQPFGPYIADFYCASSKLVIELDGSGHFQPEGMEYDRWRDAFMTGQGFRVLRFTNAQIDNEFAAVCTAIELALSDPLSQLR
ncbi:MAG: endonuclease domain-containing protein, partial [Clostridium sp.]|nr:endonuclease domain-containing protein [Clostridium sp.]